MASQELETREMLQGTGYASTEELLESLGTDGKWEPGLEPWPEQGLHRRLRKFAAGVTPAAHQVSFLGAGAGDHYLPAGVEAVGGFPADDGEVERLGNRFARRIEALTRLPKAVPQVLTLLEAVGFLANVIRGNLPGKRVICLAGSLPPALSARLQGILRRNGFSSRLIPFENGVIPVEAIRANLDDQVAAVLLASPNFLGGIEPMAEIGAVVRQAKVLFVAVVTPLSLALLRSPGEYGADLCLGDLRALGLSDRTTGEAWFAAVDDPSASWFPARDGAGALRRVVAFLDTVGGRGLRHYAMASFQNAHFLQKAICQIAGFEAAHTAPFFNEFVIRTPVPADHLAGELEEQGIIAGLALSRVGGQRDHLLVAATEMRTQDEVEYFLRALKQLRDRHSGRGLGVDF